MGDLGGVATTSRLLTRAGFFFVLLVLIGFHVAASTQTPAPNRVPPKKATTPIVLTALPVSTNQINLSWTNSSNKTAGLYVERSVSPRGPWKRVMNVPANASSCANAGLTAATTYYYRVMVNESPYSNVASATTLAKATDRTPARLTATATGSNQIDLSWSDNAGDITGFVIERCEGKGCSNFTEIASVAAEVTSYQNSDLAALTSYSYRIQPYKEKSK